MAPPVYRIVLLVPDEDEVALLGELVRSSLGEVVGVVDPDGEALGTAIAEIMGLPVVADPGDPALAEADYLVYPAGRPDAERLLERARAAGLLPLPTRHFRRLLAPPLRREVADRPELPDLDRLENEAAALERTLARVEQAIDRESLLRWLLGAALRAVGASGGSLMLHDEKAGELYVGIAHGLSEGTLHAARQRVGEGIAGRVAERLRGELVVGRAAGEDRRDRPDIDAAVCVPLVREGRLLGVLNASTSSGERRLGPEQLETLERLAPRLARLLESFLVLAERRLREGYRLLERRLAELDRPGRSLAEVIADWAAALAAQTRATRFGLALVCADGSLLTLEAGGDDPAEPRYETVQNPALDEVRRTGRPLVARQRDAGRSESSVTVFYLPIGSGPVEGVATAVFESAAAAHAFQAAAGEAVWVLQRRLAALAGRDEQRDRLERLTRLATVLAELAGSRGGSGSAAALVAEAAADLTGAEEVVVVREVAADAAVPLDAAQADRPWLRQGGRLLEEARQERWRVTLLSDSDAPRARETCLLAATASQGAAAPGLLLRGKRRLHPLDGAVFTAFDGELAGRLAAVLPAAAAGDPAGTPGEGRGVVPRPAATAAPTVVPPAAPSPPPAPPAAGAPPEGAARPGEGAVSEQHREAVLDLLRREMDRADRYHTAFALLALRRTDAAWDAAGAVAAAGALRRLVRSSDAVLPLPDGTVLLLAPEDIQGVGRLQRRLLSLMSQASGVPVDRLRAAHTVHPGRREDPVSLLDDLLQALAPRPDAGD